MLFKRNSVIFSYTPIFLIIFATLFCLLPFVGKAFNIDEPLFIWAARHIQSTPLDFYGFRINWYGTESSAAEIIKNPPLTSYFIALAAAVGGWSEVSLHLAFLLPALGTVIGTYFLARELSSNPFIATLTGLLTPVFILSSATVMCDTMMLAFYVWAVFLWVKGMKNGSNEKLLLSSLLIALSCLTKYFGMSLIPLLFLYTISLKQGRKYKALFLLVPIAILCGYQWWTGMLYGRGLLLDAAAYASTEKGRGGHGMLWNLVVGLSFTGGCLIPTLFFAPRLWSKRAVITAMAVVPLAAFVLSRLSFPETLASTSWGYYLQLSLFIIAGIHLLALAVFDLWKERDSESLLLFLWLSGTFIFACFVNWSINGRSVLPMVPVAGVLIARGLNRRGGCLNECQQLRSLPVTVPLTLACLISMLVEWSDYTLAGSARHAADLISQNSPSGAIPLVFQGHWGFQYYMEKLGASALDGRKQYSSSFIMVMPENNINLGQEIMTKGTPLQVLTLSPSGVVSDMNLEMGAGFYSSNFGTLPFVFGKVPSERYFVALMKR